MISIGSEVKLSPTVVSDIIMYNVSHLIFVLFPLITHQCNITRGHGVRRLVSALLCLLATVDDDILWLDPLL